MEAKKTIPVMENMWRETEDGVHLVGTLCKDCGEVFFPRKEVPFCSHCHSENLEEILLSKTGIVHSYTTVYNPPAGGFYKGSVPFNYIIAEFPEGVYVQGHYIGVGPDEIKIGDRVKTVVDVLAETEDEIMTTYKFAPCDEKE